LSARRDDLGGPAAALENADDVLGGERLLLIPQRLGGDLLDLGGFGGGKARAHLERSGVALSKKRS
jgi:hypothetical protein